MSRMVRKQIYIEPEQEALLKQRAKELDVSEAELIRRGIDHISHTRRRLPLDQRAWQEELAFMRQRARRQGASSQGRGWTREELYEERLERLSR